MKNWRLILIAVGLILVIVGFSYSVLKKEQLLEEGEQVFLRLAPVDPRSLMQGDYMTLNYDMPQNLMEAIHEQVEGNLVFIKGEDNVAEFVRIFDENELLASNEKRLHFRSKRWRVDLGAGSFFFQEGKAKQFSTAKFGEVRVGDDGHSVLVGLRDENLKSLGLSSGLAAGVE